MGAACEPAPFASTGGVTRPSGQSGPPGVKIPALCLRRCMLQMVIHIDIGLMVGIKITRREKILGKGVPVSCYGGGSSITWRAATAC